MDATCQAIDGNESLSILPSVGRRTSAVYFAVASLLIIMGNILTLCVVRKKKRRKPTDLLLAALAAIDLLIPLLVLPLLVVHGLAETWPGGKATCFMSAFLSTFLFKFSMLLASLVAIDRFLAISKPFFYRSNILIRPTLLAIGFSGLYSVCLALIPSTGLHSKDFKTCIFNEWSLCLYHWLAARRAPTAARIYVILCAVDTTLMIALVLFCNIGVVVYFMKRRFQRGKNVVPVVNKPHAATYKLRLSRNSIQRRSDMKYAKLMVIVSCYFPLCFLPVQLVIALHNLGNTALEADVLANYQIQMGVVSLLLNPLLHAFIRKHYRRAYWFILRHPRVICEAFSSEFDFDADYREVSEFDRKQLTLRELSVTALATTRFRAKVRKAKAVHEELQRPDKHRSIPTIVKRDYSRESATHLHPTLTFPIHDGDIGRGSTATECSESSPMNLRTRRDFNRSLSWTSSYFSDHDLESQPPSPGFLLVKENTFSLPPRVSSDYSDADKVTLYTEAEQTTVASDRASLDGDMLEPASQQDKVHSWLERDGRDLQADPHIDIPCSSHPLHLPPLHLVSIDNTTRQHKYKQSPLVNNITAHEKPVTNTGEKGHENGKDNKESEKLRQKKGRRHHKRST